MKKATDITVKSAQLYFLPVKTRVPLKFGHEVLTEVTCARVRVTVESRDGARTAEGWGETPLSVQWGWPSALPYEERHTEMKAFCRRVAAALEDFGGEPGHAFEVGHEIVHQLLPDLLESVNHRRREQPMPWLAALICGSAFDIALHDAYGMLHGVPVWSTYGPAWMSHDLAHYLQPAKDAKVSFKGLYPCDFHAQDCPQSLPAWHLVGGKDWIHPAEADNTAPNDGYPVLLRDWIRRDGLKCLKIKLRGNDAAWDFERIQQVGQIAIEEGCDWLSLDFNGTCDGAAYVNDMLDRLLRDVPRIYGMVLYIEQPFPYELEQFPIDAHSCAARKPLFLDESAHDWHMVRLGRSLGWSSVALKTCKTQTGALLSMCWAKAHGMTLMVQDLTNPMIAQVPHVLLAAHAGTIMGVETNAMQFYPEASNAEAAIHPGLYRRQHGRVHLDTITGPGFGYRLNEIHRELPAPESV
jgi:L-alanine-DL-glutamate epimerase-like enolase superfamily enzyme